MKALEDFRLTGRTSYAPSPISAGFCLIWIGIKLIADHLFRSPRRLFYRIQARLVWACFHQRNYTHRDARIAWGMSLLLTVLMFAFAYAVTLLNGFLA